MERCINCSHYFPKDHLCQSTNTAVTPAMSCDQWTRYNDDATDTIFVSGQVLPLSEYEIGLSLADLENVED